MIRRLTGIFVLAILLSGCTMYKALEEKVNPTPVVDKNATFDIRTDGRDYFTTFKINTEHTDHTEWFYYCRQVSIYKFIGGSAQDSLSVPTIYPDSDGVVRHTRTITCFSDLSVKVVAHKNSGKRSHKASAKQWEINIPEKLSKAGADRVQ